jgi:predicted DNA-binding transcriptional regulator YafY
MGSSRLLAIMLLLQARGRMTAGALASEFEVSIRTIYRDIDRLSAAGVPVYGDSGPVGGFSLLDSYRTGLTGITAGEAEALALAGFPQAVEVLGLAETSASARRKLAAAHPGGLEPGRYASRVHFDPAGWYRRPAPVPHLPALADAVIAGRRLQIVYESWTSTGSRLVDPLGLVLKGGNWYLVAAIEGRPATFKTASIRAVEPGEGCAVRPPGFELAPYWSKACAEFEARLRRASARISLSPAGYSRLDLVSADIEEALRCAAPDSRGWRTAEVPIESISHAVTQLVQLGTDILVLDPPELRAAMRHHADAVSALYS